MAQGCQLCTEQKVVPLNSLKTWRMLGHAMFCQYSVARRATISQEKDAAIKWIPQDECTCSSPWRVHKCCWDGGRSHIWLCLKVPLVHVVQPPLRHCKSM